MYALEMTSGGMTYKQSFMTIGSGIQLIVRLLPENFERPLCWYYRWDGFMIYAAEMA
jgi:hypothetical protein